MATEVTVILRYDDPKDIPTESDIEWALEPGVVVRMEEEEV